MSDPLENVKKFFADSPETIQALDGLIQGLDERDRLIAELLEHLIRRDETIQHNVEQTNQEAAQIEQLKASGRCPLCKQVRVGSAPKGDRLN